MPLVGGDVRIASVLGEPRQEVRRHTFVGGNFYMLRLLNRYRAELGVTASSRELHTAADRTVEFLRTQTAQVSVANAGVVNGRVEFDVDVVNLSGHKLPTAYPSRRAWLNVIVRDPAGNVVFESGAVDSSGAIRGNDNDVDAARFEPHFRTVRNAGEVQIYESIMAGVGGEVTTGLLTAARYVKDNRLLPAGFAKASAEPDIAVHGAARDDPDFTASGDRVRFSVDAGGPGPFQVQVALLFQPIGFRWAENLRRYDAAETQRFVGYYRATSASSWETLARATATAR
jgi:hypothetical protein